MRGRNQLFRIGPRRILESRRKRVLCVVQHSARSRDCSLPILQSTLPNRTCLALHDVLLNMISTKRALIVDGTSQWCQATGTDFEKVRFRFCSSGWEDGL